MADLLIPGLITLGVIVLVIVLMALGWRNRRRRQADLGAPADPPADLGEVLHLEELLYVATTRADQPLDRIAIAGLGYRARATVTVAASGVLLELVGERPVFVPTDRLRGAGLATWTVDRVVEQDGLVFARWVLGETPVDSYLRTQDPRPLLAALDSLVPTVQTESDPA